MTKSGKLSVILLSYFSGERIQSVYKHVKDILEKEDIPFEFIVIDDGSTDDSYSIAQNLENSEENVQAFQLSKNYTSFYAAFAGLSICQGDCATAIPDDEQQPYSMLVDMYRLWQQGEKIILPYRNKRSDPLISKSFSKLYYRIMNSISEIRFPAGGIDSFFIDKEIINILNKQIHPINTSVITEIMRLGFNPHFYPYERTKGDQQKSRWTFKKKTKLALDTILSSSSFPVKLISVTGLVISTLSFLLIAFYIYIKIWGNPEFWGVLPTGWTSIILMISFFSGIVLFSLGIIAEYIWRIYEEVKARPGYIIKAKSQSNNND